MMSLLKILFLSAKFSISIGKDLLELCNKFILIELKFNEDLY